MSNVRGRNANMSFLFGSVFFFFVIIITITLFAYFSLYKYWSKPGDARFSYEIAFSPEFAGTAYDVYMNDSLLYSGAPVACDTLLRVNRFASENALLVVDTSTDGVTILPLPDRGRILLNLSAGEGVTADIRQ